MLKSVPRDVDDERTGSFKCYNPLLRAGFGDGRVYVMHFARMELLQIAPFNENQSKVCINQFNFKLPLQPNSIHPYRQTRPICNTPTLNMPFQDTSMLLSSYRIIEFFDYEITCYKPTVRCSVYDDIIFFSCTHTLTLLSGVGGPAHALVTAKV